MSIVDRGDIPPQGESRHNKFAEGTHRFQVSYRASIPGDLELFEQIRAAAAHDGLTMAEFTREAQRYYLARRAY